MYCELSDCNSPFPTPSFTLKKKRKRWCHFLCRSTRDHTKEGQNTGKCVCVFLPLGCTFLVLFLFSFLFFFLDNKSSPACSPFTVLYLHKLQLLIVSSSSLPWKVWFWFKSKDTTLARAVYQGVVRWIEGEGNSTFSVISLIFHMLRACTSQLCSTSKTISYRCVHYLNCSSPSHPSLTFCGHIFFRSSITRTTIETAHPIARFNDTSHDTHLKLHAMPHLVVQVIKPTNLFIAN